MSNFKLILMIGGGGILWNCTEENVIGDLTDEKSALV